MSRNKKSETEMREYLEKCLERLNNLESTLAMSAVGISLNRGMPELLGALAEYKKRSNGNEIEKSENRAKLAEKEIENGFPNLNAFGVMALWGWLESFVFDWSVLWIEHHPQCNKNDVSMKININAQDFVKLSKKDRALIIAEALDKDNSGSSKIAAGRFKNNLDKLGINISFDEDQHREWVEFQQVRNCLAHRFGLIDRKIQKSCPWLNLKIGDELKVSGNMMERYFLISAYFLGEAIYVSGEQYGRRLRPKGPG